MRASRREIHRFRTLLQLGVNDGPSEWAAWGPRSLNICEMQVRITPLGFINSASRASSRVRASLSRQARISRSTYTSRDALGSRPDDVFHRQVSGEQQ